MYAESYIPAYCQIIKGLHNIFDEIYDIGLKEMQLHLAVVHLAHIQKLVHKPQHSQTVAVHKVVQVLLLRVGLSFAQFLERRHHERQRRADLVGYIRKHLQPELLQLRLALLLLQRLLSFRIFPYRSDDICDYKHIYDPRPKGVVPRREDADADLLVGIFRRLAVEEGYRLHCVPS